MLNEYTLPALLAHSVQMYGKRPALAFVDGESITYTGVSDQVHQLARFLRSRGLRKGDRIAILSESMPNWGIAYFAITGMGCIAVPILPEFHGSEVAHILRHAEAKALFISERLFDKWTEADVRPKTVVLINDFSLVSSNKQKARVRPLDQSGSGKFRKIKESVLAPGKTVKVKEGDLAVIIYTSGTTGHSKGVMLTHANIVSNVLASSQLVALKETDRLLSILPLSHTFECTLGLIAPLYQGSCIYYMDRPPVPRVMIPALAKIKPTIMISVPLVMEKLYKQRIMPQLTASPLKRLGMRMSLGRMALHRAAGKKLFALFGGELRFLGIGGAALAPEVEKFLIEARFPYAVGYGLTETSPLVSGCSPERMRFQTSGLIIPDVEVAIRNPDPKTGEGEIWVLGPNVMKGYYKDPERTAEVLNQERGFRTGDLGVLDKDGYLSIKGRMKNVIVGSSGENIYPEEIESVLNRSEWVLESLVYMLESQLCARVHLNYENLDALWDKEKIPESQKAKRICRSTPNWEKLADTAFDKHTYKHTTLGFGDDVKAMPTMYDYSIRFFERYYRPENVVLLVAGQVKADEVFKLAEKYYGPWEKGYVPPQVPVEPEQKAERRERAQFDGRTLPILAIAYKGLAFDPDNKDMAACMLMGDLMFGETSELYKKLVINEQRVQFIGADFSSNRDPGLMTIISMITDEGDVGNIENEINNTIKTFQSNPPDEARLQALKS